MCGTGGMQAHASGLGIVMGHDTKSVRCVLALESAFLRPHAFLDLYTGYSWPQGSALLQHSIRIHVPVGFVS